MLDWFRDPALRRRVQAGLNKGEARNALARAVFMHRLGEIRDRGLENQSYRASGLTLISPASLCTLLLTPVQPHGFQQSAHLLADEVGVVSGKPPKFFGLLFLEVFRNVARLRRKRRCCAASGVCMTGAPLYTLLPCTSPAPLNSSSRGLKPNRMKTYGKYIFCTILHPGVLRRSPIYIQAAFAHLRSQVEMLNDEDIAVPRTYHYARPIFLHTVRTGDKRASAAIERGVSGRKHCLT